MKIAESIARKLASRVTLQGWQWCLCLLLTCRTAHLAHAAIIVVGQSPTGVTITEREPGAPTAQLSVQVSVFAQWVPNLNGVLAVTDTKTKQTEITLKNDDPLQSATLAVKLEHSFAYRCEGARIDYIRAGFQEDGWITRHSGIGTSLGDTFSLTGCPGGGNGSQTLEFEVSIPAGQTKRFGLNCLAGVTSDWTTGAAMSVDESAIVTIRSPIRPDYIANGLSWAKRGGGVDFSYSVEPGQPRSYGSGDISLLWAKGPTFEEVIAGPPVFLDRIPSSFEGSYGPVHVPAESLKSAPPEATHLVLMLDSLGLVRETSERNNSASLRTHLDKLSGQVLDSETKLPLPGVLVTLGDRTRVTGSDGQYALTNVALNLSADLEFFKPEYRRATNHLEIPSSAVEWVVPDVLLRPLGPGGVVELTPKYKGIFIAGPAVQNPFKATIDWGANTPGRVDFFVNGDWVASQTTDNDEALVTLDMSKGFVGSLSKDLNKVTAIAVSAEGKKLKPFDKPMTVVPIPVWLPLHMLLDFNTAEEAYNVSFQIPPSEAKFPAEEIPFVGSVKLGNVYSVGFVYELLTGKWQIAFKDTLYASNVNTVVKRSLPRGSVVTPPPPRFLRWTELSLGDSKLEVLGKLQIEGHATSSTGVRPPERAEGEASIGFSGKIAEINLSTWVAPPAGAVAAKVAAALDTVGLNLGSLNTIELNAKVQAGAKGSISFAIPDKPEAKLDLNAALTLEAAYKPRLLSLVAGEVLVGGKLEFNFPLHEPYSLVNPKGTLFAGVKFVVRNQVKVDKRFVLLALPRTAGSAQPGLASLDDVAWLIVPLQEEDDSRQPRHPSSQGPELFVAAGASQPTRTPEGSLNPMISNVARPEVQAATSQPPPDGSPERPPLVVSFPLLENALPEAHPSIASWGPEILMVYAADGGHTNTVNFTDIRWMKYDGTNWSAPATIESNEVAEFAPQVAFDGHGDALAVWERTAGTNYDFEDINAMSSQMEIFWSKWNRATGGWSPPAPLTSNGHLDHSPVLAGPMEDGKVLLVWTENHRNLLMGTNGAGSTVRWTSWSPETQSWGPSQMLLTNLEYRLSQSLAGVSNRAVYAWSQDQNRVPTNDTDQEIFYRQYSSGAWGPLVQFTTNAVRDRNVQAAATAGVWVPAPLQENFESGDLKRLPWSSGGTQGWVVQSSVTKTGAYAASSGLVADGQTNRLVLKQQTTSGFVSFSLRVSSEPSRDVLSFLVDGVALNSWSGETVGWIQASFELTEGEHTLEWRYSKDATGSLGNDRAWVDDISLPSAAPSTAIHLVWEQGTNWVHSANLAPQTTLIRPLGTASSPTDVAFTAAPSGNLALIWGEQVAGAPDARYRVYDSTSRTWSEDLALTQNSPLSGSFFPAWDAEGHLVVAHTQTAILHTNQTVTLEGGQTMTFTDVPESGRTDLWVTRRTLDQDIEIPPGGFSVTGSGALPGDVLTLEAVVRNAGDLALRNFFLRFHDGDPAAGGKLITNIPVSGTFWAGATNRLAIEWTVPAPASPHVLYATVSLDPEKIETNSTNRVHSVPIGATDLAVRFVSSRPGTNGSLRLVASVLNLGAPSAAPSVLALRRRGETNAPLATVDISSIDPGCEVYTILELPPGSQPPGDAFYTLTANETRTVLDQNPDNDSVSFAVELALDSDQDGVADADERTEGTDPLDAGSLRPRLAVLAAEGKVMIAPSSPNYAKGTLIKLTAIPDRWKRFIGWAGDLSSTSSPVQFPITSNMVVSAIFGDIPSPGSTLWEVPGTIQAEDFADGGEGIGYHDVDPSNQGGLYRNTGVDIATNSVGGGYRVGWTAAGEWLNYSLQVRTSGLYRIALRTASAINPAPIRFEIDTTNATGRFVISNTGDWNRWMSTTSAPVYLGTGAHTLRLVAEGSSGDIDSFQLFPFTPRNPDLAGMVGWWQGENDFRDMVGGNHGVPASQAGFTPGVRGRGLLFNESKGFIDSSTPAFTNILNDFTIEFWAFPKAGRESSSETASGVAGLNGQRYAVAPEHGASRGIDGAGVGISVGTNGVGVFEHTADYLPSTLVFDGPIVGWTHVAVVYRNLQPRLYLNGRQVREGVPSGKLRVFPSKLFGRLDANRGMYVGALDEISIYDRALDSAEIEGIFFSGKEGKRIASSITGQWDFDRGDLSATIGADLVARASTLGLSRFTSVTINGQTAQVMQFPAANPSQGYLMPHKALANQNGSRVNGYTLIADVMYPSASQGALRRIWQTDTNNTSEGDLAISVTNGIGAVSQFDGSIRNDTWHRIAFAFNLAGKSLKKYIDGKPVGEEILPDGLDGRWSLGPLALLFTDNNGETRSGYVNSVQFHNRRLSDDYLSALGKSTAEGIPTNAPPFFGILSPQIASAGYSGQPAHLVALGRDLDDPVERLEIYDGPLKLAASTSSWLNLDLDTRAPARHVFTERMIYASGLSLTSSPVEVIFYPTNAYVPGFLRREVYTNIAGVLVSDLTNHASFGKRPAILDLVRESELPRNADDNYGVRLTGYVIPPVTGSYLFYVSSDDQSFVFLSTDESPSRKRQIASEPSWSGWREFITSSASPSGRGNPPANVSSPIPLQAGRRYYLEALMKEGVFGDSFSLAWKLPGGPAVTNGSPPIPSISLATGNPLSPPVLLSTTPGMVAARGGTATFSTLAVGGPPLAYGWWHSDRQLTTATNPTLTINNIGSSDSGEYRVVVTNAYGAVTSPPISLSLLLPLPPRVTDVVLSSNGELRFKLVGEASITYVIESSRDLSTWEPLTALTNQTGSVSVSYWATNSRSLFFRALAMP